MNAINSERKLAHILGMRLQRLREFARNADSLYRPFVDTKKGKSREIDRPMPMLRELQRCIYRLLLRDYPYSDFVRAGVPGRSITSAVSPHHGQPMVIRLDIRNFYPSISDRAVFAVWRRLGHGSKVAALLTRLTTYQRRLPQGAPTSMALANLYLEPVDGEIFDSLHMMFDDLSYTRWVDDLIFSGTLDPASVFEVAARHLRDVGLFAHRARAKRGVMPSDARQAVLGTVVNVKVALARKRRRTMRAIIHTANKFGGDANVLRGHLQYLRTYHQSLADQLQDSIELAGHLVGKPFGRPAIR